MSSMFSKLASTAPLSSNKDNPMKDFEVPEKPFDSVTCMMFSPQNNFLIASSWDNHVKCWKIENPCNSILIRQASMTAPIMDIAWSEDGTTVFMVGHDKMVKRWDLNSNQCTEVAAHEALIKTCHFIPAGSKFGNCLMTGSSDKTVKLWDLRAEQPIVTFPLPGPVTSADVDAQNGVVSLAGRQIIRFQLDNYPPQMQPIGMQNAPQAGEHRCISLFQYETGETAGFAFGNMGGQVGVNYVNSIDTTTDNLDCHRSSSVNAIKFHPTHGTMATVGSDGTFAFWNPTTRKNLKTSLEMDKPITSCSINYDGQIFAYSVGYDWAEGANFNSPEQRKSRIFLRTCMTEEMRPYK